MMTMRSTPSPTLRFRSLLPPAVIGAAISTLVFAALAFAGFGKVQRLDHSLRLIGLVAPFAFCAAGLAPGVYCAFRRTHPALRTSLLVTLVLTLAPVYTVGWCMRFWPHWSSDIWYVTVLAAVCAVFGIIAVLPVAVVAGKANVEPRDVSERQQAEDSKWGVTGPRSGDP